MLMEDVVYCLFSSRNPRVTGAGEKGTFWGPDAGSPWPEAWQRSSGTTQPCSSEAPGLVADGGRNQAGAASCIS